MRRFLYHYYQPGAGSSPLTLHRGDRVTGREHDGRRHRRSGRSGASTAQPSCTCSCATRLNAAPVAASLPRSFGNAGRRSARGALEPAAAPPNASSEPGSLGRRRAARAPGAPLRTCGTSGLPSVVAEGELRLQVGRVGVVDRPQRVLLHPVEHARRGDAYGEAAQHEGLALDVLESERVADARDEIDGEPVRGAVAHDGVLTGEVLGANLLNLGIVPHPRQRTPQAFDVVGRRFDEEVDILREARNPVQIDRLSAEEHVADPLVLERSKEVGQPVESRWHSRSQDSAWSGALTAMRAMETLASCEARSVRAIALPDFRGLPAGVLPPLAGSSYATRQ